MWSDADDAIIGGDLTAALGYVTPAGGAVVSVVAPIGLRDRDAGTVEQPNGKGQRIEQQRARVVLQRVPLVLADLGVLEQHPFHQRQKYAVVDPVLRGQLVTVHLGQCDGRVVQHGDVVRHGVGGQVG